MKKYNFLFKDFILVILITSITTINLIAQTGPGGVGTNDGGSSLKLWLRADENVSYDNLKQINEWVDYSGNSFTLVNCATQPVFQSNFVNGFPAVYFSSVQAGLFKSSFAGSELFSAQNNTVIFVKRSESGSYFFRWENSATDQVSFQLNSNKSVFNFPNNTTGQLFSSTDVNSAFHIISNVIDGTDQSIFLDGSIDGTKANASTLNTALNADLYLGTYNCTASNDWVGYISEAIIFNTNLNTAERILVENYLSAKYDLTISNDYYAGDDAGNGDFDYDVAGIGEEADGNSVFAVSDGVYISEESASLDPAEYVIIGHNTLIDSVTVNDVTGSVTHRWNKIWYVDKTGNVDTKIAFDFSEGIDGGNPGEVTNYRLLYRAGTTGNFSEVTVGSTTIENTDQVAFVVADVNLNDGFYTIGTVNAPNSPLEGTKTWYNYYVLDTDDWDDWKRWTLDPDGTLLINPTRVIPGASDTVVILNGSTVNINTDNKIVSKIQILNGGILNIDGATTGHDFSTIMGEGRMKLEADNYPDGDDSDFRSKGTVEFYGGGTTYNIANFNTSNSVNNLVINLDNAANTVVLKTDIDITNNFTVKQGIFQINNTDNDIKYIIDITGNVVVESNGQIATGSGNPIQTAAYSYTGTMPASGSFHDVYHELNIGGNFTNHGSVRFTNLTAPLYNQFATNGAVTVRFNGSNNNTVNLYSTAYFYNLVIDKGNSQTYITTVYSANNSYFNIYGGNAAGRNTTAPYSASNPEVRKALFIYNGTLKLTGNIRIPSLSEGALASGNGDYAIGANASLWIAGSNVSVYSTATASSGWPQAPAGSVGVASGSSNQALTLFGTFRISDGNFSTRNSAGIIFWADDNGTVQIEGGTVDISQFRSASGGSGKSSYIQSGGVLSVRGDVNGAGTGEIDNTYPIFGLVNPDDNFQMSGGIIYISDVANGTGYGNNEFYINCDDGNFGVSGGTVLIEVAGGTYFDLYSTSDLWNLNIERFVATVGMFTVRLGSDLNILNDLSIDDDAQLDPSSDGGTTNYNLNIASDFTIGSTVASNSVYVNRNNTTTFSGSGNSIITVSNDATSNYFSPYNFVIDKNSSSNSVTMVYRGGTTSNPIANIRNDFTISRGTFNYDSYIVDVKGDLNNSGIMGVWNTTGKLRLNSLTQDQDITTGIGSGYVYGHLEIDKNTTYEANLLTNASCDFVTLINGNFYIGEYKLSVDTNMIGGTGFSATKMIMTQGQSGDRGLDFKFNLTNSAATNSLAYFPVGVTGKITPVNVDLNVALVGTYVGNMRVVPVLDFHPALLVPSTAIANEFYWKTYVTGDLLTITSANSNINLQFTDPGGDTGGGLKEYYVMGNDWFDKGNASSTTLTYEDMGFAAGDFTASKNIGVNFSYVFYSRQSGNWDDPNTWSRTSHTGASSGDTPLWLDVVYIGGTGAVNHTVTISNNTRECANLTIYSGDPSLAGEPTLDVGTSTGHSFAEIHGGGRFRISYNGDIPDGNWDDFVYNDTAIFEYYGGTYTIPTDLNVYPNLQIAGNASSVKTLPNIGLNVLQDLMIYDNTNTGVTLRLSNNATSGYDLYVQDSLKFDNQGTLIFPATGAARTVTVEKSIDLAVNANTDANRIEIEDAAGTYASFHSLIVKEDMVMNDNALITLYRNKTNRRAVNLYFQGSDNSEITSSASILALNNLIVNKGLSASEVLLSSDITLTDNTDRPITLTKGHLIFDNSGIDVSLSSGDGNFTIPEFSKLSLRNGSIGRITGANTGILLNGSLFLENNSQLLLNDGTNNNYIEYSSTGNSIINVSGTSILNVGSQIRRKTTSDQGVLKYYQSGGTVTVGNNSAPTSSRGVFEVLNTGSVFNYTGGNLIIARAESATDPALYLAPASYSLVGGATLTFGNANTPAAENIGIYSTIPLKDIEVSNLGGAKTVTIYTLGLNIDSLNINSGQAFNANGYNLTLNGNFRNSGTYTSGTNTTSFTKANQKLIGATTFNNVNVNLSTTGDSLALYSDINVNGDFTITKGRFHDRTNTITLLGDLSNAGTHFSQSNTNGGFLFNHNLRQEIGGTGTYGLLEVNNSAGVELLNDFILVDRNIKLTNGSLYIKQHQLQLGITAGIVVPSGTFSKTRMVVTNGALSDLGIRKAVGSGTPSDILIPIGTVGTYTPVKLSNITTVGTGYVSVRPVSSYHPTAIDPTNVLQYYWNLLTLSFTSFKADVDFYYDQTDVSLTGGNLESDYIPAYLQDVDWSKFGAESVDAGLNIVKFNFTTGVALDGDFTAGISDAIPDQVPVFVSISDGNWENMAIWEREDAEPVTAYPNGFVVKIKHDVTTSSDLKSAYKTILDTTGNLIIGNTIGHYLGRVSGRGQLSLQTGRLPAGNYDDFFDCSGGTIEWGGDVNYELPAKGTSFRRMIFSGTGTKTLSSNNITICDTLWITGGVLNNQTHDNTITLNGLFDLESGEFHSGTTLSTAAVIFSGSSPQIIRGDFTGNNRLNNATMNNASGLTIEGGDVTLKGDLTLTLGNIIPNGNTFTLETASSVSPDGGSASSFVDGPLYKKLANGSNFKFPLGDGTRYGKLEVLNTVSGAEITWLARYYNQDPTTDIGAAVLAPIVSVSDNEYWQLDGTVGGQAQAMIRWDSQSGLPAQTSDRVNNLDIARWSTALQWEEVPGTVADGGVNSGTITSNAALSTGEHFITISTKEATPLGTATITSGNTTICSGSSTNISISLTGTTFWTIEIYKDGILYSTETPVAASPYLLNVTQAGVYTINRVWDTNGTVLGNVFGSGVTITVIPTPDNSFFVTGGGSYCSGGTGVAIGLSNSELNVNYELLVDGSPLNTVAGTGAAISFGLQTTEGSYTVEGTHSTDATGLCTQTMTGNQSITVVPAPNAVITVDAALDSICDGSNTQMSIDFISGTSPFNFTITDGITPESLVGIALDPYTFTPATAPVWIDDGSPDTDYYYTITTISDANGCTNTNIGNEKITVFKIPETGPQFHSPNNWGD